MSVQQEVSQGSESLADAIQKYAGFIVSLWLTQVEADVRRSGRHVQPTELRDGIGDYLQQVAMVVRSEGSLAAAGSAAWRKVAEEHAVTRVRLGFDIDQLVHEFALLRRSIADALRSKGVFGISRPRRAWRTSSTPQSRCRCGATWSRATSRTGGSRPNTSASSPMSCAISSAASMSTAILQTNAAVMSAAGKTVERVAKVSSVNWATCWRACC